MNPLAVQPDKNFLDPLLINWPKDMFHVIRVHLAATCFQSFYTTTVPKASVICNLIGPLHPILHGLGWPLCRVVDVQDRKMEPIFDSGRLLAFAKVTKELLILSLLLGVIYNLSLLPERFQVCERQRWSYFDFHGHTTSRLVAYLSGYHNHIKEPTIMTELLSSKKPTSFAKKQKRQKLFRKPRSSWRATTWLPRSLTLIPFPESLIR